VVIGKIQVKNELPPSFSPAVLAPITDRTGTINWDNGEMGSFHDGVAAAKRTLGPRDGVLVSDKPEVFVHVFDQHDHLNHFTKKGSGQTWGNLIQKRVPFPAGRHAATVRCGQHRSCRRNLSAAECDRLCPAQLSIAMAPSRGV
jgi:hypothetical protein